MKISGSVVREVLAVTIGLGIFFLFVFFYKHQMLPRFFYLFIPSYILLTVVVRLLMKRLVKGSSVYRLADYWLLLIGTLILAELTLGWPVKGVAKPDARPAWCHFRIAAKTSRGAVLYSVVFQIHFTLPQRKIVVITISPMIAFQARTTGARMIRHRKFWQSGLCAIGASICTATFSADIYRSENPDGTERFASQAIDAAYAFYLKGDPAPVPAASSRSSASPARPEDKLLEPLIRKFSQKHSVDPALVRAVIEVESGFNPQAISRKGAVGAMQIMPATAARYGATHPADPAQNIEAGIRYLKDLLALHKGNLTLALASYNAGEGAVARHGHRIPPYRETMLYVPAVLARFHLARTPTTPW
jgi:hypothetical protein